MAYSYRAAVEELLQLGLEGRALKWDLANVCSLLERLGHPQQNFSSVHIAGTNGKGSVAALVEAVLRRAGTRTGLYTSPHLVKINERIAVSGRQISDEEFAAAFSALRSPIETLLADSSGTNLQPPSFFECLTAMAFWHFARSAVEAAVVEVGLGGRLDATNVLEPVVTAITSVDFDHERYLGHSIEQIAAEKAGILKPGVPVINAGEHPAARRVISERARALGGQEIDPETAYQAEKVERLGDGRYAFTLRARDGFALRLSPALRGRFQIRNTITAVAILRQLQEQGWMIPAEAIAQGVQEVSWPGRLERVDLKPRGGKNSQATLFLDGAHNPAAARQVRAFWEEEFSDRRIHLVYGSVRDKAVGEIAELLFPHAARVVVTEPTTTRAVSTNLLEPLAQTWNESVWAEPNPVRALERVLEEADAEDIVFVTGSLFLVGDIKRALDPEPGRRWSEVSAGVPPPMGRAPNGPPTPA
jgi:dihydrofolate synthase/folylpolyglutamate synthase